jgi:membrane protease YdiL (CAAX protease family)
VELAALVRGLTPAAALLLAAVSGLAEEALFRGALQPALGWLAASALFGLAHFLPRPGLRSWSLAAALAGLGLGKLFAWSGDLVAPVLAHALLNAVNLLRLSQWRLSADPGTARP